jgi:hypothetical protein
MFANTLNNFDAIVELLTDNPILLLLQAQQSHLQACVKKYPDLADIFSRLYSRVQSPDVALWSFGDFHPEVLCGFPMTSSIQVNAINHLPTTSRLDVVAENPLLLLLTHAAHILSTVF